MTASYRFLSWVRRGAASQIITRDTPSAQGTRVQMPIAVVFNDDPVHLTATASLSLSGPGDIVNFDRRAVVRTWPAAGALDAEANYFPTVELDQVDLPWRYTPRRDDTDQRLRPWMCLIAVREGAGDDGEIASERPARGDRALPSVTLKDETPLPRLDQSWAWAHVQIAGTDGALETLLATAPHRCLARLMCPRRLDPDTRYSVFLVPTFEVGRRAGLRLPLAVGPTDALAPAWTGAEVDGTLELPVYYRWRFSTGPDGDFEALVERLKPYPLPDSVGFRDLDVATPGAGLPPAAASPLPIGGALQPTTAPTPPATAPAFVTALGGLLDLPAAVAAGGGATVVAPPLYGGWHARRTRVTTPPQPPWFQQLNLDPRTRVAAALGTEVVQAEQHALMEAAWDQVAGIREANAQLAAAQLAVAIGDRLHRRFVVSEPEAAVVAFAGAALGQVRHEGRTVKSLAANSPSRLALVSGAFRRAARPLGPVGRRQARPDEPLAPVIGPVNAGTYDDVLEPKVVLPPGTPTVKWLDDVSINWPPTAATIGEAPNRPMIAWDPIFGNQPVEPGGSIDPSVAKFRTAAVALANRLPVPAESPPLRRLDLPAVRLTVVKQLQPSTTIPAGFGPRMTPSVGFPWNPPDPIEPVMAHPVFPQPMYAPLAARSPDWILPGLFDVPSDSATLVKTNPAFIESYLVGLNHEMSRELLWNEYPTDQRGSYFQQFWDVAGLPPATAPHTLQDIKPLHTWLSSSNLGAHSPRALPPTPDGSHLVLLVRGEVLRRYPGTLVYAQRAVRTGSPSTIALGSERLDPVFAGRLAPDVAFFGFATDRATVKGIAPDPGWFFVFAEQPGEPKFGLDAATDHPDQPPSWDELAWRHLVKYDEDLAGLHYIDLSQIRPITAALEGSGGYGWHLTPAAAGRPYARGADHAAITCQRPARVAILASLMLTDD